MHRPVASLVDRALPSTRGDAIISPHAESFSRKGTSSSSFITRGLSLLRAVYRKYNSLVTIYTIIMRSAHSIILCRRIFLSRTVLIERRSLGECTVSGMLIAFPRCTPVRTFIASHIPSSYGCPSRRWARDFCARLRRDSELPASPVTSVQYIYAHMPPSRAYIAGYVSARNVERIKNLVIRTKVTLGIPRIRLCCANENEARA